MRKDLGEFNTLYKDLRKYPDRFYTYYRMSTEQFDTILAQIQHLIYKPDSKWQHSISLEEKLAICIRYEILFIYYMFKVCKHFQPPTIINTEQNFFT